MQIPVLSFWCDLKQVTYSYDFISKIAYEGVSMVVQWKVRDNLSEDGECDMKK